jgi:hypothetical protein
MEIYDAISQKVVTVSQHFTSYPQFDPQTNHPHTVVSSFFLRAYRLAGIVLKISHNLSFTVFLFDAIEFIHSLTGAYS